MGDDLFEEVKTRIPLQGFIETETGSRAKKAGADTFRVNPCPLCGHEDCFTLYPSNNSFHCFSCLKAGTIVDFEIFHAGISDPLQAAKSIAGKVGFSPAGGPGSVKASNHGVKESPKAEKEAPLPRIEEGRAKILRGIVADFYHEQLLSNKGAFEYQVKKRGHSLITLKAFKVGFAGRKSIIAHVKKVEGFCVEDLMEIGVVGEQREGFIPIIPQGVYLYPHRLRGDVLFFSLKDPSKKFKWQIKKMYAGPGWLCFGQDALEGPGPVALVEGEDDLLSVAGKAEFQNVAATLGNFNTSNILAYLRENSKGRSFYLCFDRDAAGARYTQKYTAAILAGGGAVRVVEVPERL